MTALRFEKEPTNRFHEYIRLVTRKRNVSLYALRDMLVDAGIRVARQWTWEISKRPTLKIGKRTDLIDKAATILGEPMSKLSFLAGFNPWAKRLDLLQQGAVWEFIERLVRAREEGMPKPPALIYHRLLNSIFGGMELSQPMTSQEMADFLRPTIDTSTEG